MAVEVKTMEVKKNQQVISSSTNLAKDVPAKSRQLRDFMGDIKIEFKKISWTNPEELISYTKIVVAATFLLGMGIYMMDLAIRMCLSCFGFVLHLIGG